MPDDTKKTTAEQIAESLAAFTTAIAERFNTLNPNDPAYPLSVVVVASPRTDEAAMVLFQTTAICNAPGHKDGWPQALAATRDMLLLCNRMNADFGLGLELLPAVLAQHPMMQKYLRRPAPAAPAVTNNPDGTRTVVDVAESTAEITGGVGVPTKH